MSRQQSKGQNSTNAPAAHHTVDCVLLPNQVYLENLGHILQSLVNLC